MKTESIVKKISLLMTPVLLLTGLSLSGCQREQPKPEHHSQVVTAALQESTAHLYYNGVIQPLHVHNVVSPVDGIVQQVYFSYGTQVKKDQLLFTVSSDKLQENYATALTDYVKNKDQFLRSQNNFTASGALYNSGLIDKESYLTEKSQFRINQLAYINSKNNLQEISKSLPGIKQDLDHLSLDNLDAVQKLLTKKHQAFSIFSPADGVAITPSASGGDNESSGKDITSNSEVKHSQVLAGIGDMSGISCIIHVSESDIGEFKLGQAVTLTFPALPAITLNAEVSYIAEAAKPGMGNSGMAMFPIHVTVAHLSPEQRSKIRSGMNVKADIEIKGEAQIKLPIKAVFEENDQQMVNLVDPASNTIKRLPVKTGTTDISNVIILDGLKPGDQVQVND